MEGLVHAPGHRGSEVRSKVFVTCGSRLRQSCASQTCAQRGYQTRLRARFSPRMRSLYDWAFSLGRTDPGWRTLNAREYVGYLIHFAAVTTSIYPSSLLPFLPLAESPARTVEEGPSKLAGRVYAGYWQFGKIDEWRSAIGSI